MLINLLYQVALIIIVVRSTYMTILKITVPHKLWLDILFHASIAIVAIRFLI
jgi:hypothetical protein